MRKLLRSLLFFIITIIALYVINDKYKLTDLLNSMLNMDKKASEESFVNQVRQAMLDGKEQVELQYIGKVKDMEWFSDGIIDMASNIDSDTTSSDYDYLRYKMKSISTNIKGLGNVMTVTYNIEYNETVQETLQVDQKVEELLNSWDIEKLTDYNKIKKIHDYIIENATYDVNLEHYTAYENLINQRSTCQGYMTLAYKMITEAGVPCRIITGMGEGESHGWNIVKLEGKWYNLDCTWDDPVTKNGKEILVYDYFLKSNKDFGDHVRSEEFDTEEFYKEYEMAEVSYGNK